MEVRCILCPTSTYTKLYTQLSVNVRPMSYSGRGFIYIKVSNYSFRVYHVNCKRMCRWSYNRAYVLVKQITAASGEFKSCQISFKEMTQLSDNDAN